jgi:hypothetical protein
LSIVVQSQMTAMVRKLPLLSSRINDGNWSKIASHVKATSVSCGHISAAGNQILGVRFGEIIVDGYY